MRLLYCNTMKDETTKAAVLAALATGRSLRDVAREHGVSAPTAMRWRDAAASAKPASAPSIAERAARVIKGAPAAPPPAPVEDGGDDDEDTLATLKRLLRAATTGAREAKAAGNHTASQRFGRDAAGLAASIARLEHAQQKESDHLRLSRADIAETEAKMREKVKSLLERPLLCAHCSRELSIEWGGKK